MLPDLFKRLKPLYGRAIDLLWIEHETADVARKLEIEQYLTLLAVKRQGVSLGDERLILDPPPPSLIGDGEYDLGMVQYPGVPPYPFRVRRNELLRHTFILGPTGTGKSTLILGVLLQLLRDGVPFLTFDFKRNYRCLLGSANASKLVVLTVGGTAAPLAVNALQPPPGVSPTEWCEALADCICDAYLLLQGARNVLSGSLQHALHEHGERATLQRAYDYLKGELGQLRAGSRKYGWLESSVRSLEEVCKGAFGRSLNASTGSLDPLFAMPVVIELQGLGDDQKRFFCLYVLQYLLLLRKTQTIPREELHHVLVFDESQNVFPKERPGELGVPSRLAREIREFGEAIIAATQQTDVADSLIANSGIKLILRTDYPRDVSFAAALMQIDARWFPKLQLGSGIARLPVRFYTPFLFTFPAQPLKNTLVTDTQVRERSLTLVEKGVFTPARFNESKTLGAITEKEDALLRDVAAHPISYITKRYERLGWSATTGNDAKNAVIEKGLASFTPVATGTAQAKILALTKEGATYLAARGVSVPPGRRGGVVHEYWRWVISERLRARGFQIESEAPVGGGKTVDLRARMGELVVHVEIETGKSDIPANIAKCAALEGVVFFFFVNSSDAEEHLTTLRAARAVAVTPETLAVLDRI